MDAIASTTNGVQSGVNDLCLLGPRLRLYACLVSWIHVCLDLLLSPLCGYRGRCLVVGPCSPEPCAAR